MLLATYLPYTFLFHQQFVPRPHLAFLAPIAKKMAGRTPKALTATKESTKNSGNHSSSGLNKDLPLSLSLIGVYARVPII